MVIYLLSRMGVFAAVDLEDGLTVDMFMNMLLVGTTEFESVNTTAVGGVLDGKGIVTEELVAKNAPIVRRNTCDTSKVGNIHTPTWLFQTFLT